MSLAPIMIDITPDVSAFIAAMERAAAAAHAGARSLFVLQRACERPVDRARRLRMDRWRRRRDRRARRARRRQAATA